MQVLCHLTPVAEPTPSKLQPEFLPMDDRDESGEVPPLAEEQGLGESREQNEADDGMSLSLIHI